MSAKKEPQEEIKSVLGRWRNPDNPHIIPLPYYQNYTEYASLVRSEIMSRNGQDFIIAVDLPHGLEETIIRAVKDLPIPSLILDPLNRGIPIIPSSAPIEAVRSYLEYGLDLRFIDAPLPITPGMDEYQSFIQACRSYGIENVVKNPATFGVRPENLFQSWVENKKSNEKEVLFPYEPEICLNPDLIPYRESDTSLYLQARLKYMAGKVRELVSLDVDILLVCDVRLMNGILYYLRFEPEPIDDSYLLPTRTITLTKLDMLHVSGEIPFFSYLYELFRDQSFSRQKWIRLLFSDAVEDGDTASELDNIIQYASNLACTRGSLEPGLYELIFASDTISGSDYTERLFEQACMYPPAGDPGVDQYNFLFPYQIRKISHIEKKKGVRIGNEDILLVDYNFVRVVGSSAVLQFFNYPENGRRTSNLQDKLRKKRNRNYFFRWKRTTSSLKAEREFTRYILSHFSSDCIDPDACWPVELSSGLQNGIDVRETMRNVSKEKIYVKNAEKSQDVCYIFDYRALIQPGEEEKSSLEVPGIGTFEVIFSSSHLSTFFLDKYYPWVGLGRLTQMHYDPAVLVLFLNQEIASCQVFQKLRESDPLRSAIELGFAHASRIILFTDCEHEIKDILKKNSKIVRYSLSAIPSPILLKMKAFDIDRYRRSSKRGD